jgi:hypothetical protein
VSNISALVSSLARYPARNRADHDALACHTEDLPKAVVYYRTLFDELLEVRRPRQANPAKTEVVHS